jgi:hypothetical protein
MDEHVPQVDVIVRGHAIVGSHARFRSSLGRISR